MLSTYLRNLQEPVKKAPAKRAKRAKKIEIEYEADDIDLEPGQSILSSIVEQEVYMLANWMYIMPMENQC